VIRRLPSILQIPGWGRVFSACVTDQFGPVKALKCQFPFRFGERVFRECSMTRTPSAKDQDCKNFWRRHKDIYPSKPGEVVSLQIERVDEEGRFENITKECYSFLAGESGWCVGVGNNMARTGVGVKTIANTELEQKLMLRMFWLHLYKKLN